MGKIKTHTLFLILIVAVTFLNPCNVKAEMYPLELFFDGSGSTHGTNPGGGGGGMIMKKPYLRGCGGIKVNLVKIDEGNPKWVSFYHIFTKSTNMAYHSQLVNPSYNPSFSAAGRPGIYGQIGDNAWNNVNGYAYGGFETKTLFTDTFSPSNKNFFIDGNAGVNFSPSKVKQALHMDTNGKGSGTDLFYKALYALLVDGDGMQHDSTYWPAITSAIGTEALSSEDKLRTFLNDTVTNAAVIEELKNYRIIIEPIYTIGCDSPHSYRLFLTSKALFYFLENHSDTSIPQSKINQLINNTSVSEQHGTINSPGTDQSATLSAAKDVNNKYGYVILSIVNSTTPPPPDNPDEEMFECPDGTFGVNGPDSVGTDAAKEPFNNYYLFLLKGNAPDSLPPNTPQPITNHGGNNVFNEDVIFREIISQMFPGDPNKTIANTIVEAGKTNVIIHSENYDAFYTNFIDAVKAADFYIKKAPGNYYIWHHWYESNGVLIENTDHNPLSKNEYKTSTLFPTKTEIDGSDADHDGQYIFEVRRTMPDFSSIQGTFYSPGMYKVSWCLKLEDIPTDPDCDDRVNKAFCNTGSTKAEFHENDQLSTCTIKKNNHSGFVAIDKTDSVDMDDEDSSKYCTMACKEDIEIELPGKKKTAAGQYFLVDNYTPKIKAERTCVTDKIKFDEFKNDKTSQEPDIKKTYNLWHDYKETTEHLQGGTSGASGTSTTNASAQYGTYEQDVRKCKTDDYAHCGDQKADGTYPTATEKAECEAAAQVTYTVERYTAPGGTPSDTGWKVLTNNPSCASTETGYTAATDTFKATHGNKTFQEWVAEQNASAAQPTQSSGSTTVETHYDGSSTCTTGGSNPVQVTYSYQTWTIYAYNTVNGEYNFSRVDGHWEQTTACSGGGEKVNDALNRIIGEHKSLGNSTARDYYNLMKTYTDTLNNYNRCFNWIDLTVDYGLTNVASWDKLTDIVKHNEVSRFEKYKYEFEPTVTYWYEDEDGQVFPVEFEYDYENESENADGDSYVESSAPNRAQYFNTTVAYWGRGEDPGETYDKTGASKNPVVKGENEVDVKVVQCTEDDSPTCDSNDEIDEKFYESEALKRKEEITYTYHLPKIVTTIPDGKVHLKKDKDSQAKPTIELDLDASPVNVNTLEGTYNFKIKVENIIDDLRARKGPTGSSKTVNEIDSANQRTVSGDGTNDDDDMDTRFLEEETLNKNKTSDYVCTYDVVNDVYIPDESRFNFFYRTIDPFEINPTGRTLGYNWTDVRGDPVRQEIAAVEEDYKELTETQDHFVFKLTPGLMQEIRMYNAKQALSDAAYADWDLECYDYDSSGLPGYHCYSTFLSCLASDGAGGNCPAEITQYAHYSKYTGSELATNRNNLINKQTALDEQANTKVQEVLNPAGP